MNTFNRKKRSKTKKVDFVGWLSAQAARLKPVLDVVKWFFDLALGFYRLVPGVSPSVWITIFHVVYRIVIMTMYLYMAMNAGWGGGLYQ